MRQFLGDDWAEDHHDVELVDDHGSKLARKRLPEGLDGVTRLHALVARTHQTLIWDRSRQLLRLRSALREFFPAALDAFDDLTASDALELLSRASDPARAARLSRSTAAERYLNEAIDMCPHNRDLANSVFVDVALRRLLEQLEAVQVRSARVQGWSWQEIAAELGVSRQAVHKKYGRN